MSCTRGRADPDEQTRLRLFAHSGGYCQNPQCLLGLFVDTDSSKLHIAEIAHIVAASDAGPRADAELSDEERGSFENLILLCPTCHTTIDKASKDFPDTTVREWKHRHAERIAATFGVVEYPGRRDARRAIDPALAENEAIFREYGSENEYRSDPESELADVWKRKVLLQILPNNRRILAILDANRGLLRSSELTTLEDFRQHVDDLEARHLGEGRKGVGRRFPVEMETILAEAGDA
jgi:hypothetical protein